MTPVGRLPPGASRVQPVLCAEVPGEGSDMQEHPTAEFPCTRGLKRNLGPSQGIGIAGERMALQPTGICEGSLKTVRMYKTTFKKRHVAGLRVLHI